MNKKAKVGILGKVTLIFNQEHINDKVWFLLSGVSGTLDAETGGLTLVKDQPGWTIVFPKKSRKQT